MAGDPAEKKEAVALTTSDKDGAKNAEKNKKKGKDEPEDELTPEDRALLEGLELAVTRLKDQDAGVVEVR